MYILKLSAFEYIPVPKMCNNSERNQSSCQNTLPLLYSREPITIIGNDESEAPNRTAHPSRNCYEIWQTSPCYTNASHGSGDNRHGRVRIYSEEAAERGNKRQESLDYRGTTFYQYLFANLSIKALSSISIHTRASRSVSGRVTSFYCDNRINYR